MVTALWIDDVRNHDDDHDHHHDRDTVLITTNGNNNARFMDIAGPKMTTKSSSSSLMTVGIVDHNTYRHLGGDDDDDAGGEAYERLHPTKRSSSWCGNDSITKNKDSGGLCCQQQVHHQTTIVDIWQDQTCSNNNNNYYYNYNYNYNYYDMPSIIKKTKTTSSSDSLSVLMPADEYGQKQQRQEQQIQRQQNTFSSISSVPLSFASLSSRHGPFEYFDEDSRVILRNNNNNDDDDEDEDDADDEDLRCTNHRKSTTKKTMVHPVCRMNEESDDMESSGDDYDHDQQQQQQQRGEQWQVSKRILNSSSFHHDGRGESCRRGREQGPISKKGTTVRPKTNMFDLAAGLSDDFNLYACPTSHEIVAEARGVAGFGAGGDPDTYQNENCYDDDERPIGQPNYDATVFVPVPAKYVPVVPCSAAASAAAEWYGKKYNQTVLTDISSLLLLSTSLQSPTAISLGTSCEESSEDRHTMKITTTISPRRTVSRSQQPNDKGSVEGFEHYLREVMQYSESFLKRVVKQSKVLLEGQGVHCRNWPDGVVFQCNFHPRQKKWMSAAAAATTPTAKPDLSSFNFMSADIDGVVQDFQAFERRYGKSRQAKYILRFPLNKLLSYQQYLREGVQHRA